MTKGLSGLCTQAVIRQRIEARTAVQSSVLCCTLLYSQLYTAVHCYTISWPLSPARTYQSLSLRMAAVWQSSLLLLLPYVSQGSLPLVCWHGVNDNANRSLNSPCSHLLFHDPSPLTCHLSFLYNVHVHICHSLGLHLKTSVLPLAFIFPHLLFLGPSPAHTSNFLDLHMSTYLNYWPSPVHTCNSFGFPLSTSICNSLGPIVLVIQVFYCQEFQKYLSLERPSW